MITEIARNFNGNPNIVTMVTDSDYTALTTSGFLTNDENVADIEALQNGEFQWQDTDIVLIAYNGGTGFFTIDAATNAFVLNNTAGAGLVTPNYLTIPVSSSDILAMYVTPKLLLPAGGANTLLLLERGVLVLTFNSVAYTDGGPSHIQYDSTTLGAGVPASTSPTVVGIATVESKSLPYNQGTSQWNFPVSVNKGLYLSNTTASFTAGNSSAVMHLWYKTISVA